MNLEKCHNQSDLRKAAKKRLPSPIFNYIDGGADDEWTLKRNTLAFDDYELLPRYLRDVDQVVRQMPLWKLQTVGSLNLDFLYENRGRGTTIELRPGVAYCLRRFYGLISDLVRGAWIRYVRRHNHDALRTTADEIRLPPPPARPHQAHLAVERR